MAVLEAAQKVWELHDSLGGGDHANETLFENLVRFLSGDTLDDFVDDFCRHHEMPTAKPGEEDDDFFSDREANPHDGSMYGEPEGGHDEDDEIVEYCVPI
jgi:hypothetical protein